MKTTWNKYYQRPPLSRGLQPNPSATPKPPSPVASNLLPEPPAFSTLSLSLGLFPRQFLLVSRPLPLPELFWKPFPILEACVRNNACALCPSNRRCVKTFAAAAISSTGTVTLRDTTCRGDIVSFFYIIYLSGLRWLLADLCLTNVTTMRPRGHHERLNTQNMRLNMLEFASLHETNPSEIHPRQVAPFLSLRAATSY